MEEENIIIKESKPDVKHFTECMYVDLIPAKMLYFFSNAGVGSMLPFINVFLISIGFSISQAGIILGVRFIPAIITLFGFGVMADYTQKTKLITLMLEFTVFCLYASTPLLPILFQVTTKFHEESITLISSNTTMYIYNFSNVMVSYQKNPILTNQEVTGEDNTNFFIFMICFFILTTSSGYPSAALMDSTIAHLVKTHKKTATYGNQRVFAPVGYAIGAFTAGLASDLFLGTKTITKYSACFFCYVPFGIGTLMSICLLKFKKVERKEKSNDKNLIKLILQNCMNHSTLTFLVTVFISGTSYWFINGYFGILLEEMSASKTTIGILVALSSISEIIIFPISKKIQTFLGSPFICFFVSVMSFAIRFLFYSFMNNAWLMVPLQVLHAFGYGLFWATAVEYTYEISKSETLSSMFNVVAIIYHSFGGVISHTGGGFIYQHLGGRKLFAALSVMCFVWSAVLIAYYLLVEKPKASTKLNEVTKGLLHLKQEGPVDV